MFSDDSGSDTSSERSLSPSPPSLTFSSSFVNPIRIPLKSRLSPPSTTSADLSFSPTTPPSSSVSPHTVICAYPSWPAGDFLSAQPSTFSPICTKRGNQPSSRISDEDLLGLEELDLCGDTASCHRLLSTQATEHRWEEKEKEKLGAQPEAVDEGDESDSRSAGVSCQEYLFLFVHLRYTGGVTTITTITIVINRWIMNSFDDWSKTAALPRVGALQQRTRYSALLNDDLELEPRMEKRILSPSSGTSTGKRE
ncbi:MAG: hypothetical protein Q9186_005738 [Xanthomendoza sp. 1 TL-2023]